MKRYRQGGTSAIRHKSRDRTPNNQIHAAKRDYALSLIKEQYPDFGPTLAAEMLVEHHGFKVSRETVRKWMQDAGIWLSRKLDLSRFDAAPLIAFTVTKETDYGTETDG